MAGIDGASGGGSDGRGNTAVTGPWTRGWSFYVLAGLGLIELECCFYGAHAQSHHRITTAYGAALVQALPYLLASWLVLRTGAGRRKFWLMIGFALAFRSVALFGTQPYLSTDVYRYVWDGRVEGAGINPYRYVSSDPALGALRDAAVYGRMNRPDARTIYPPGAEMFFFMVTRVWESVGTMRVAAVACEAVAVWGMCGLLQTFGLSRKRVLLYAWHPLPVWEFAGSGHVDAVVVAALVLGLWAVRRGWATAAGIALASAVAVKLFPVVLFPAFYRRWDWKLPLALAATIAIVYLPYLGVGLGNIFDFLLHGYASEEGLASGERFFLAALLNRWCHVRLTGQMFQGLTAFALAGLAAWVLLTRPRDALTPIRRAAALAVLFNVLLSPGYAWYFAWLVIFLPFVPWLGLLWLTTASFVLYANWLHTTLDEFFVIHCVLYVPAAVLAVGDLCGWKVCERHAKKLATRRNPGKLPA